MDFDALRAELAAETERLAWTHDMVGQMRDADLWQPARKCPSCGRYAHSEAGNDSEFYWMITDCAKCGRWEVRGGPMEWRSHPTLKDRVTSVRKLED